MERKNPEQLEMKITFRETYRESFGDWNLNIEDENPSSESSANFNRFLGITKYTANTIEKENKSSYFNTYAYYDMSHIRYKKFNCHSKKTHHV